MKFAKGQHQEKIVSDWVATRESRRADSWPASSIWYSGIRMAGAVLEAA